MFKQQESRDVIEATQPSIGRSRTERKYDNLINT